MKTSGQLASSPPTRDAAIRARLLNDNQWLDDQWPLLVRDYPGSFVAVCDRKVIANATDRLDLTKSLRAIGMLNRAIIAFIEAPGPRFEF